MKIANEKLFREHFTREHIQLSHKETNDATNQETNCVFSQLINSIIQRIENEEAIKNSENNLEKIVNFKCYYCKEESIFVCSNRTQLDEHLNQKHNEFCDSIKCFFCSDIYNINVIGDFIDHLKSLHSDQLLSTALNLPVEKEESENNFNWDSAEFKQFFDNKFVCFDEKYEKIKEDQHKCEEKSEMDELTMEIEEKPLKVEQTIVVSPKASSSSSSTTSSSSINATLRTSTTTPAIIPTTTTTTVSTATNGTKSSTAPSKTWTCQLCKKQFEQRVDLNKHQCIELNLKLFKKKKEIRKKKWREAHWKRIIDLSYIETTSLTQLSQNIADNLSFCIDGTNEG
jgi:hypothetical protein